MKKLLAGVLGALMILVVGCASAPNAPSLVTHQVELKVTSDQPVKVDEGKKDWDIPGLMKPSQLMMINEENTRAWIKLFSGLSVSDVTRSESDMLYLEEETKIRDVTFLINSPGGDAFSGLALADLVADYRAKGWTVRCSARGIVASAAVPIFAAGYPRTAAPGTIFMVHEAALWKWPGRETASDIRAQNELMALLRDRYLAVMVKNSKLSLEQWQLMEVRTSWFGVEKAKEFGLVD